MAQAKTANRDARPPATKKTAVAASKSKKISPASGKSFSGVDVDIARNARLDNKWNAPRIAKEFARKARKPLSVKQFAQKIKKCVDTARKGGSGRPRATCSSQKAAAVRNIVDNACGKTVAGGSISQVAGKAGIPRESTRRTIKKHLKKKSVARVRAQRLTDARKKRLVEWRQKTLK